MWANEQDEAGVKNNKKYIIVNAKNQWNQCVFKLSPHIWTQFNNLLNH